MRALVGEIGVTHYKRRIANYNLSQCEDYEPKLVTEEKRKAIKEALKHFNMID